MQGFIVYDVYNVNIYNIKTLMFSHSLHAPIDERIENKAGYVYIS